MIRFGYPWLAGVSSLHFFPFISDDVRQKFNNLKNYFSKEKKRHVKPSGSSGATTSKWEWFSLLSFLDGVTIPGPSESNLNLDISSASFQSQQTTPSCFIVSTQVGCSYFFYWFALLFSAIHFIDFIIVYIKMVELKSFDKLRNHRSLFPEHTSIIGGAQQ